MGLIGEMLLTQGLIDQQKLDFCLNIQANGPKNRLGKILSHYQFILEDDLIKALAVQHGLLFFNGAYKLNDCILEKLGLKFCLANSIYPLKVLDGSDVIVISDPCNIDLLDALRKKVGYQCVFYLGLLSQIKKALNAYSVDRVPRQEISDLMAWVNEMLLDAILMKASDVHIEPSGHAVGVRFRIDGLLQFYKSLPIDHLSQLVNIIFHRANVTVSDFYHFHDARFSYRVENQDVDIRFSHIPTIHGSSIVLRILEMDKTVHDLPHLGYSAEHLRLINSMLHKPDGIVLIVGPTGCGKTTSLYAMLNQIKDLSRKIITIEDPVEMPISLISQIQVNDEREVTFANSLRACLRHDPDMLLIGEIRDQETAMNAVRASMTGHKVFATLHTTRAIDAIYRLHNLGVDHFLISQSLSMVIAQRLVRTLCDACKKQCDTDVFKDSLMAQKYIEDIKSYYKAHGCSQCKQGYIGRTVVAEICVINDEMKKALIKGDHEALFDLVNNSNTSISFVDHAKELIKTGQVSIDEIIRVLG